MRPGEDFFNLYNHDLIRLAVAVPRVKVPRRLRLARKNGRRETPLRPRAFGVSSG